MGIGGIAAGDAARTVEVAAGCGLQALVAGRVEVPEDGGQGVVHLVRQASDERSQGREARRDGELLPERYDEE